MILENHAAVDSFDDLELSENYVGDASEFAELTNNALSEMHNFTVALARLEHKCLVENDQTLMEAGVKEFFAKAAETIKKWWNTFVQWLGSLWTKLKDAFVKRADWLGRNKAVIAGVDDAKLKDVKATLGKNLFETSFSGAAKAAVAACQATVNEAGNATAEGSKTFKQRAMDMIQKPLKHRSEKNSAAKNIHDSLIGEPEEVAVNKALVGKMLGVAEDTFKAVDQMKGAKAVADAAIKHAEGMARVEGGDQTAVNAKISALREVGHIVQGQLAGYSSAISTANGMVMPVLVRVAGLAGKKEEAEDGKPAGEVNAGLAGKKKGKPAGEVNAGTSLLAAYL